MRPLSAIMLMSLLTLLTGCHRLPAVNAKVMRYESSYPIGGTSIVVKDVEVTEHEVKAGEYSRTTKLWGISQSVHIEGYSRARTPDAKPEILAP